VIYVFFLSGIENNFESNETNWLDKAIFYEDDLFDRFFGELHQKLKPGKFNFNIIFFYIKILFD